MIFNVSAFRSDALLLTADGQIPLELPKLGYRTLVDRVNTFHAALRETGHPDLHRRLDAQDQLADVLDWLWEAAAEPVLRALDHHGPVIDGQRAPGPASAGALRAFRILAR
ncbi:hypothetical protein ACIBI4_04245 [Streptomyces sp. NPDC050418]|uniref:hypothetical protein n=1 Tax=Streptomyces sp. NPDC050418 TaxID=3365612 RepID=UPI0037976FB4